MYMSTRLEPGSDPNQNSRAQLDMTSIKALSQTVQPSKRAAPCSTEQEGVSVTAIVAFTHQHLNACSDEECPSCWLDGRRTVNTTLLWIPTAFPVDVFASQEKPVERRYAVDNGSLLPSARKFNPGAPVVSSGVRLPSRSVFSRSILYCLQLS